MSAALKIFIIYAREDESFKISLLKAFKPLHRTGKIEIFHDGLIKPGERWEEAILENLRTAHIILPLVSTDFFDSEFIHEVEFKKAVDRYNKGETTIIPIILKHCGWRYDPIIPTLQVLPKDGKPVVMWTFHEEAWEQILDAVHEVAEQGEEKRRKEKEAEVQKKKEEVERRKKEREKRKRTKKKMDEQKTEIEAEQKIEEEIDQRIKMAEALYEQGIKFGFQYEFERAIICFNRAIELNPKFDDAYNSRGISKEKLGQLEKARDDYKRALDINSSNSFANDNLRAVEKKIKAKEKKIEE